MLADFVIKPVVSVLRRHQRVGPGAPPEPEGVVEPGGQLQVRLVGLLHSETVNSRSLLTHSIMSAKLFWGGGGIS